MTIGSPVASPVSGPGCEETYAIRWLSGDHAMFFPVVGSGALVPSKGPRYFLSLPSGRATSMPDLVPRRPEYAIHFPSGDHSGSPDGSSAALRQIDFRSTTVMIQSCATGRSGPSFRTIV